MSKQPPHGLLGSPLETPPNEGLIQDLSWNPKDKHRFAIVTSTGSARVFSVNPVQQPYITLIGSLPLNLQACCLSWSPKGKQLALAVTGAISGASSSESGNLTSIVQVDPDLKVKRIIPIGDLLKARLKDFVSPRPIDILWTSSYCFLVGVEDSDLSKGIQLVFVTALQKVETRLNKLPDFTSFSDCRHQYHLRLVPNSVNLVAVTWTQDAEECFLLEVPSISTAADSPSPDSVPRLLKSLPLPTDGFPIAMDIGALIDVHDPIPVILGLLNNGAMFAFKISPSPSGYHPQSPLSSVFAGFKLWCGSADKQPCLPPVNAAPPNMTVGDSPKKQGISVSNRVSPGPKSESIPIVSKPSNSGSSYESLFGKPSNFGSPKLTASAPSSQSSSGITLGEPIVCGHAFLSTPNVAAIGSMSSKPTNQAPTAGLLGGVTVNTGDAAKSQVLKSDSNIAVASSGSAAFGFGSPSILHMRFTF